MTSSGSKKPYPPPTPTALSLKHVLFQAKWINVPGRLLQTQSASNRRAFLAQGPTSHVQKLQIINSTAMPPSIGSTIWTKSNIFPRSAPVWDNTTFTNQKVMFRPQSTAKKSGRKHWRRSRLFSQAKRRARIPCIQLWWWVLLTGWLCRRSQSIKTFSGRVSGLWGRASTISVRGRLHTSWTTNGQTPATS